MRIVTKGLRHLTSTSLFNFEASIYYGFLIKNYDFPFLRIINIVSNIFYNMMN